MKIRLRLTPSYFRSPKMLLGLLFVGLTTTGYIMSQGINQSGGPGSSVTANAGTNLNTSLLALESGGNIALIKAKTDNLDVALSTRLKPADTLAAVTSLGSITSALPPGTNLLGFTMTLPAGCSGSGTALVVHNTVGVATGAGTSISVVTGCIVECWVNNITNSPVTFRLADKTGTPIIWLGGNADFSIPSNSNMGCAGNNGVNLSGVIMASGMTAIAGTAAALNLHLLTRE